MPPALTNQFDARFRSGKFIETIPAGQGGVEIPIRVQNARYPLKIWWSQKINNLISYAIDTGNGIVPKRVTVSGAGYIRVGNSNNGTIQINATAQKIGPCPPASSTLISDDSKDFSVDQEKPTQYLLSPNYPDPFNPSTRLQYALPIDSKVRLTVYNILGQVVAELVNGVETAGYKSVEWNATNFSSGVYFYRLEATSISDLGKSFTQVKKMLLIK